MKYRLIITKEFDKDIHDLWGVEEFLKNHTERADGLAAFTQVLQEDVGAAIEGATWALEELDEELEPVKFSAGSTHTMRNLNKSAYADRILTHYIIEALRSSGATVSQDTYAELDSLLTNAINQAVDAAVTEAVEKMKASLGVTP